MPLWKDQCYEQFAMLRSTLLFGWTRGYECGQAGTGGFYPEEVTYGPCDSIHRSASVSWPALFTGPDAWRPVTLRKPLLEGLSGFSTFLLQIMLEDFFFSFFSPSCA